VTSAPAWATFDSSTEDGFAHETVQVGTNVHGGPIRESLCGRFAGSTWTIAGPGVVQCQECRDVATGSPD